MQAELLIYQEKIREAMKTKDMTGLEQVLNSVVLEGSNTEQLNSLYYKLRMEIIHAQIMQASFFQWRRIKKEKTE